MKNWDGNKSSFLNKKYHNDTYINPCLLKYGMTWVIGAPTIFGYCLGLADIQATFTYPDGTKKYLDCLQKIYPIENDIVAGFSGSIKIGFALIEDLKQWAHISDGTAWIPDCLVLKWKRRAKWLYKKLDPQFNQSVQLLLLGVYPQKNNGIPGCPQTYGCVMKSPNFIPELIQPNTIGSIGGGNNVDEFMKIITDVNSGEYNSMMQMEVQNPGGYGSALAIVLSLKVKGENIPGISGHFHICELHRRWVSVSGNDHTEVSALGSEVRYKMPDKIATNWDEFIKITKDNGILCVAEATG